jgi:hypothetical protein
MKDDQKDRRCGAPLSPPRLRRRMSVNDEVAVSAVGVLP